ncbi:MAG: hypothetical protein NTX91_04310 [candidate division SR1 bacterium]|nr:hypothetical protein [candidate division SR1 bacterium]
MVLPEALSTACTSVGQSHYLGDSYEGTTLSSVARRDVVYLVSDDSPTGTNNFYMSYVDNAGNHVAQVGYTGEPEHGNTIYLPKGYAIRVQCMDSGTNIKFHYLRMRSHDF